MAALSVNGLSKHLTSIQSATIYKISHLIAVSLCFLFSCSYSNVLPAAIEANVFFSYHEAHILLTAKEIPLNSLRQAFSNAGKCHRGFNSPDSANYSLM